MTWGEEKRHFWTWTIIIGISVFELLVFGWEEVRQDILNIFSSMFLIRGFIIWFLLKYVPDWKN